MKGNRLNYYVKCVDDPDGAENTHRHRHMQTHTRAGIIYRVLVNRWPVILRSHAKKLH